MLNEILHGWHGLAFGYTAVQAPMLIGLARYRAEYQKFILSPLVAAPLTAIAGTLAGLVFDGSLRWTMAGALGAALGYAGGRALSQDAHPLVRHERGALIDGDSSAVSRRRARSGAEITLAGHPIPARDESKHFKLIGTTGTGKSTAIEEILDQALGRGDRAVIADPDAGYLKRYFRRGRDVVLNPFESESVRWDLFAEIRSAYDVDQLARSLIPDHDGQDRSWRAYARTFLTAVTRQAHAAGVTDVGELYRLLVVAETNELRTLVRGTPAQPFLDEHNSRMFDSIRSVTSTAVSALEFVAQQQAPAFSVRRWVAEQDSGCLFLPYRANQIAALHSPISAWMRLAIFETLSRDPKKDERIWFVVDELDALGQIDGLKDALARLRKFGGRCVLGLQSVSQVSATYGAGDAHTIVENCGNTLILRCSTSEGGGTARFASQLIGERQVLRVQTSRSRRPTDLLSAVTRSEHLAVEPAVLPSQLEQLPDLAGYLKCASDPRWRAVKLATRNPRILGLGYE